MLCCDGPALPKTKPAACEPVSSEAPSWKKKVKPAQKDIALADTVYPAMYHNQKYITNSQSTLLWINTLEIAVLLIHTSIYFAAPHQTISSSISLNKLVNISASSCSGKCCAWVSCTNKHSLTVCPNLPFPSFPRSESMREGNSNS